MRCSGAWAAATAAATAAALRVVWAPGPSDLCGRLVRPALPLVGLQRMPCGDACEAAWRAALQTLVPWSGSEW